MDTLRVNNTLVQANNSELWQNYLVFAPAAAPGSQPPFVVAGDSGCRARSWGSVAKHSATIVNRDTTVNISSVIVQVNGVTVPSTPRQRRTGQR